MLPLTSAPAAAVTPDRRPRATRPWLNVGLCLAALCGVHLWLDAALPLPNVGEVSEKLAYFARHKDEFDAVFIGSSRVCRQIAPGAFDARVTAATGQPMRSFNLGAPSMFLPESLYVIDRVLAQRPARLRWMFIELDDPRPRLEEHAGLVRREVYWHGWRETTLVCAQIVTVRGIHKGDRVRMLAHQIALFGRRWTHLGRAQEWFADGSLPMDRTSDDDNLDAALGPAADGYAPYRGVLGEKKGGRGADDPDTRSFLAATAALKSGGARTQTPPTVSLLMRWLLTQKADTLRSRGIEPVFVIAPVTTDEETFRRLAKEGAVRPLFAFNDPAAYPELYQVNMRADTMHLNEPGSLLFTRLLAERFADYRADVVHPR